MNTAGDPFHEELTDDELDDVLAAVHQELSRQVHRSSPAADVLVAIMASEDGACVPDEILPRPNSHLLASMRVGSMVSMRCRATEVHERLGRLVSEARDIAVDLDRELSHHRDLAIGMRVGRALSRRRDRRLTVLLGYARDMALQIVFDMAQVQCLDHDLAVAKDQEIVAQLAADIDCRETYDGVRELDRALALDRQVWIDQQITEARELSIGLEQARILSESRERKRNLDRRAAHHLALDIDLTLQRAHDVSGAIRYRLSTLRVNASCADLSRVLISDPSVLAGVIWTADTLWPQAVTEGVRTISLELRPGIFQVRPPLSPRPIGRHAQDGLTLSGR